jgi:hypothetical protein
MLPLTCAPGLVCAQDVLPHPARACASNDVRAYSYTFSLPHKPEFSTSEANSPQTPTFPHWDYNIFLCFERRVLSTNFLQGSG